MAYETRELQVKISGDTAELDRALGKSTTVVKDTGNKIAEFAKVAAVALAAATTAVVAFGVSSVKAFEESQNVAAQTNAVLKSTAGAAGITADQVSKLATALEKETRFSDETVASTENLLLTFTSIGKDIFPQVTETALDMATALGEDTKSAAIQLGKALQDPVLGVTALRRVGVNFSDKQKDVIQKLVDTNQKAEAQKLILKELQTEFGGSAKAAGQTFAGQLDILKNRVQNVQEGIGEVIVKGLVPVTSGFLDWYDSIGSTEGALKKLSDFTAPIINNITAIADKVGDYLSPKFASLWKTIQRDLIPTLGRLWHDFIEPMLPVLGTLLVGAIGLVIDALHIMIPLITGFVNWAIDNKDFLLPIIGALAGLKAALMLNDAFTAATVAFKTFQLVTIPQAAAQFSWFAGLLSTPLVMPAIAVGAALAAIAAVWDAYNRMKAAVEGAKQAQQDLLRTTAQLDQHFLAIYKAGQGPVSNEAKAAAERARQYLHNEHFPGFATGGFTGTGSPNEVAGFVHKGEFVLPQSAVDQSTGLPKMTGGSNVTLNVNVGMYAGMPVEKRQIALEIYKELVRAGRAQGVQLPMIGAVGVQ